MHLILCVLKDFMKLWFKKDGPWSLKQYQDFINEFLKSVSVPDYITRIPRSTEHFSKWKANEFRSFLLYFSVIILSKCMKPEYFQHWLLLVSALNLLLQDCISQKDVQKANILLRLFCSDFSYLYGHESYTYYIHMLVHLGLVVERHGPLYTNSAFMFESFNGTLAKHIHGTKNQGKELVNNIRIALGVEVLEARTLRSNNISNQPVIELRNLIRDFNFSVVEEKLLSDSNKYREPMKAYYRAVIKKETFTCSLYTRQKKRNNFTICFQSSSENRPMYGEIKYFCQSDDNDKLALVQKFNVDHNRTFCHAATGVVISHIIPVSATVAMEVIDLSAILFKVIRVENYICLRPNKYEYNL